MTSDKLYKDRNYMKIVDKRMVIRSKKVLVILTVLSVYYGHLFCYNNINILDMFVLVS